VDTSLAVWVAPGRADRGNDAETRAHSNSSWCREGPRVSLINGVCCTKESRAWPGHPILIPRGGPRPCGSDRKITALTGVGGSSRRSRLWVGMWLEGWSGCCWGEGDGEPQGVQLPDVVAGLLVLVDAAGVVAGAQVVVAGGGVGQQMPDDHQDGA